ncbi:amidohydrolase family protein [Leifsonia sp. A12D58]|uniref:metal-dependent hydrolase family protein n=1 Tax=Leifsonia sp. A12D58 TaxID=3397674 RepID=UPI0039E0767A
MQHTLTGIELWDGRISRGPSTLTWTHGDTDAVITSVGEATTIEADSAGLSVIPGLIDTHVHLIGNAGKQQAGFLTWPLTTRPEEQVLHGLAHARRAMQAGVTTMRDLSADEVQVSLRRGIEGGLVEGPRVLAYGLVGMTGGHGDMFTPAAHPIRKPTADGPDECRKLVRYWARAGVDGIKIATSGGVLSDGDKAAWRNYTRAEIDAVVDEAHALGMKVAAHAHTADGIDVAIAAGVDSLEHATLITAEQAAAAAVAGITLAPTLLINDVIANGMPGVSPEQSEKAQQLVVTRDALMRAAADIGAEFVLGTDANGFHVKFGDEMAEVRRMAEVLGYSPERALQAATSRAAKVIGYEDSLGTLAPGYLADFVVMRGRPWEDAAALDVANIVAVVARGRVVFGELPR